MKLILLRHGESKWNQENRFTGWKDVSLTENGILEAEVSGKLLVNNNIEVQSIHTSLLKRATETAAIVSKIINFSIHKINYDWRLNERHYGALQGLNKSETAAKYGEEQVKLWRRSYDVSPPFLDYNDNRHPRFDKKFQNIHENLPSGESLKDVIKRLNPFLDEYFSNLRSQGGSHLIVAHSNSLRAIVKILDKLSNKEILDLNIPTGVPLLYELDNDLTVLKKKYLISDKELLKRQKIIINQGKA